jgi:predicted transcriptional regulator
MLNNFSERLKSLRGSQSKADFARFLGVSAPLYQRYEEGRTPRSDILSVIATKCNKTVEWLLAGKESVMISNTSDIRDMIIRGMGATGKNAHDLAELMGVSPGEVQSALKGDSQNLAFTHAFEQHVQPIIDMRKKGVCPNCVKEIDRLNKIIDKLIQK